MSRTVRSSGGDNGSVDRRQPLFGNSDDASLPTTPTSRKRTRYSAAAASSAATASGEADDEASPTPTKRARLDLSHKRSILSPRSNGQDNGKPHKSTPRRRSPRKHPPRVGDPDPHDPLDDDAEMSDELDPGTPPPDSSPVRPEPTGRRGSSSSSHSGSPRASSVLPVPNVIGMDEPATATAVDMNANILLDLPDISFDPFGPSACGTDPMRLPGRHSDDIASRLGELWRRSSVANLLVAAGV